MSRLIEFALCGTYSKDYDPYFVTREVDSQRILLAINASPLSLHDISEETRLGEQEVAQRLEELGKCQLVKKIEEPVELYQPNFAIFSLRDQKRLQPLVEKLSESLVNTVKDFLPQIKDELRNIECVKKGFVFADLEYIVVGAYTLDYGGLAVLKEEGLLTVSKEMPGGSYVFAGLEAGLVNLKEAWMWGHNDNYGKYTFSTHGELPPKRARKAFPDLSWVWVHYAEDDREKKCVEQRMVNYGDLLYELLKESITVDGLAERLNRRKAEVIFDLTFLEELEYVVYTVENGKRGYALNRPALLLEDYERINKLSRKILKQFVTLSLGPTYSQLEKSYEETSPARNSISIQEAFNPIYHSLFEKALGKLMSSGVIAKPPLRKDCGRYSPWIATETEN